MTSVTKNIARGLVFSLALATVPAVSAHGEHAIAHASEKVVKSAWQVLKGHADSLWYYLEANPVKSGFTLALAGVFAYTTFKKSQRPENIEHHDNLVLEGFDNLFCGQIEKDCGFKKVVNEKGEFWKKDKIKATGLIGNALAMAKPLAYTAGTLLVLNNILGLTLPDFAVNYAKDAQTAANLIKS